MNQGDWRGDNVEHSAFDRLLESDKAFFRTVSRQLTRLAACLGLPPAEVEQVVAEAWLKAVKHRYLFEGVAIKHRLRCWLIKVVSGKSVDALRRLSKHPDESLNTCENELIDATEAKRAKTAEEHEWLEVLLEEASQGDEENVCLLRLHYFQGISIPELARLYGMTDKSVDSRIRRLVKKMGQLAKRNINVREHASIRLAAG